MAVIGNSFVLCWQVMDGSFFLHTFVSLENPYTASLNGINILIGIIVIPQSLIWVFCVYLDNIGFLSYPSTD